MEIYFNLQKQLSSVELVDIKAQEYAKAVNLYNVI